jgi:hypothetical protein
VCSGQGPSRVRKFRARTGAAPRGECSTGRVARFTSSTSARAPRVNAGAGAGAAWRRSETRRETTRGEARRGKARRGEARRGVARRGKATSRAQPNPAEPSLAQLSPAEPSRAQLSLSELNQAQLWFGDWGMSGLQRASTCSCSYLCGVAFASTGRFSCAETCCRLGTPWTNPWQPRSRACSRGSRLNLFFWGGGVVAEPCSSPLTRANAHKTDSAQRSFGRHQLACKASRMDNQLRFRLTSRLGNHEGSLLQVADSKCFAVAAAKSKHGPIDFDVRLRAGFQLTWYASHFKN